MNRSIRPSLEAQELSFGYSSGSSLLDNWSASFYPGTITALTGSSGRGKSTLLYLLGLMLTPSAGEILVEQQSVSYRSDAEKAWLRAHRFGFVFQDAALDITRSVMDNVTETALYRGEPRKASASRALDLLDRFEVDVHPSRKPSQVSGGQAQRIALCRALLFQPSIVLADEPTGNLDPASSKIVIGALREHADSGGTVLIVTHSPEIASGCDNEIVL
ncbi:ABC transporter ATP-binding protein [Arthrobacter glacialis]|uniref:ABC transporter n=1 Tax=Arthrobacter glacialis TaxID=1664 RepID=A0A2S4A127_ARTGL|nr:ATP-binding cassette domain-containing protein [Arthrobacter glacialis]POH75183.1 ABC transporter [Arthrobacter glacialis]